MKLEDGALQAYRKGKVIESYLGYLYQIDTLPCKPYKANELYGALKWYLRLDDAQHKEWLGEWKIIEEVDPKQKLKEMITQACVKYEREGPDILEKVFGYIDTLKIEEVQE
jgi:hypothetical protein